MPAFQIYNNYFKFRSSDPRNVAVIGSVIEVVGGMNAAVSPTLASGWLILGDNSVSVQAIGINPILLGLDFDDEMDGSIERERKMREAITKANVSADAEQDYPPL